MMARVVKLQTDDGSLSLKDTVKVGETFIVDLSTKSPVPVSRGQSVVIQALVQCAEDGKWLPMECLELLT
jgi:hypothetical protein